MADLPYTIFDYKKVNIFDSNTNPGFCLFHLRMCCLIVQPPKGEDDP